MNLTGRDRKIMLAIVPVVLIVAYWFLLLAPQRKEATAAKEDLAQQEQKRDDLESKARQLETAKAGFTTDYASLVRLGKAIPTKVDMPSLIVQLDDAAKGTGITFTKIKTGERTEPVTPPPAPEGDSKSGDSGDEKPTESGGQAAQSAPGQAAESANNAAATSDQRNQASEQSGVDATTSTSSKQGGLPVGGGATAPGAASGGQTVPGLESVPLEFEFNGSFFDLSDFFHSLKRFVRVTNKEMEVRGRLLTIDGLKFSAEDHFPSLKAEIKATVWLSPKSEGPTAGATPAGPGTTPASSGANGIAAPEAAPSSPATPTATVTP